MKASLLYRISSILLLLFAAGHTFAFAQLDPNWRIDEMVHSMQTIRFNVNGSERTYWDFYFGFGLFVTVLLLFAAIVAWQFASFPPEILAKSRVGAWGFAACFAAATYLNWCYFFIVPLAFSTAIFVCLAAAAVRSTARNS